ncbi:MAG: hypothetical protein LBU37_03250 [Tannerellaceae bacterium]|nr:hypothetical protein [Tannerellaceae bacterium]
MSGAILGHYPVKQIRLNRPVEDVGEVSFDGIGVVFGGGIRSKDNEYVGKIEVSVDGKPAEIINLPVDQLKRRHDIYWKYQLPAGKHTVSFKWLNPAKEAIIHFNNVLVYADAPVSPVTY